MLLDNHIPEFHDLGNDLEEWAEIRVRKDFIPKGATLVEAYLTERELIVCGTPKENDASHNCDAMGCTTLSHVLYRLPLPNAKPQASCAKADAWDIVYPAILFLIEAHNLPPSGWETLKRAVRHVR